MHGVVDEDVLEVPQATLPNGRERAHVHERRTVAVDAEHLHLPLCQRNAQRYGRAVPHASDGEEVLLVGLPSRGSQLEHLPGGEACGGDQRILREVGHDLLEDLLTVQHVLAGEGFLLRLELVLLEGALLHQKRERSLRLLHFRVRPLQHLEGALRMVGQDIEGYAHLLQERGRELALEEMLRLVLPAWLSSPADEQQSWDGVHLGTAE
mmetsp:Transcript_65049/g.130830  ORF Transcript_65049/g.130830 Transcript_65049/m.130830 type:complete len:209 (-) Transcript_65049:326-952(-)